MVMTNEQAWKYYVSIFNWLSVYTPGSRFKKDVIQNYHNKVWQPIRELLEAIGNKRDRTEEEESFLESCSYYGSAFRVHSRSLKQRKFIYETGCLQSWSKNLTGIKSLPFYGELTLIISHTDKNQGKPAICVFGVLEYLFTYKKDFIDNQIRTHNNLLTPDHLLRYEVENEVIMPLSVNHIEKIIKVKASDLVQWEECGQRIPRSNWRRESAP